MMTDDAVSAVRPEVTPIVLTLHYLPPSMNRMSANRSEHHRKKKNLQHDLAMAMLVAQMPRVRFAEATAVLRFPTSRRRDAGNYSWLLDKALGDALVSDRRAWPEGRYLPDDTPAYYRFTSVTFDPELGPPRTRVILQVRI